MTVQQVMKFENSNKVFKTEPYSNTKAVQRNDSLGMMERH